MLEVFGITFLIVLLVAHLAANTIIYVIALVSLSKTRKFFDNDKVFLITLIYLFMTSVVPSVYILNEFIESNRSSTIQIEQEEQPELTTEGFQELLGIKSEPQHEIQPQDNKPHVR